MNNNKGYDIKNDLNALYCSPSLRLCFCGNNNPTLLINDDSDTKGGTCCKALDTNYNRYLYDYELNNGKEYFTIVELEVFKVIID